jgi:uncharacterized membrane protein (UPF0127 family)
MALRRRRMPQVGRLHVDGRDVAVVELARSNAERRRGLLGRDGLEGGLWLEPCRQVHTLRMRFPIDVAHVDRRGVVSGVRTMPPGRFGPLGLRTRAVLEAEAGSFAAWGLSVGSQVRVVPAADGQPTHSGRS